MTAIVKHISVHPDFKYHRRTGIFDELDKREAEAKQKRKPSSSQYRQNLTGFMYVNKTNPVERSPFTPTPEK